MSGMSMSGSGVEGCQQCRRFGRLEKKRKRSSLHPAICAIEGGRKGAVIPAKTGLGKGLKVIEISGRQQRVYHSDRGRTTEIEEASDARNSSTQSGIKVFVNGFLLPKGFPQSVTEDYLEYQVRCLPAHVTGWMSRSLATSSLIHALNVGSNASSTVAASAAIKWITKDGIGAFGRFLVGGRLGGVFDEDPRRWRMIAVGFATVGLAFEIATTAFPGSFVLLAGIGNLSKALGKGLSSPSFRIIQTHFALANNIGDISAKEEVWEVAAQLTGLASSVVLLKAIEASGKPESVLWIWALNQVVHVGLRYYALNALQFKELNQKRASILAKAHVTGEQIPGIKEANRLEPMLASSSGVGPRIEMGSSVDAALKGRACGEKVLAELAHIYAQAQYWLVWENGSGHALLKEDCRPTDILRIIWQGTYLEAQGVWTASSDDYKHSLDRMDAQWPDFLHRLQKAGWDIDKAVYRLGDTRIAVDRS